MKTLNLILIFLLFSLQSHAQFFKNLADKAVNAATRTVERKVEEKSETATSNATDKVLNPKKGSKKNTENQDETSPDSKKNKKSKEIKSAKDFVPGNTVLVFEDFLQDAIGDFPVNWLTNSSGEVVTISETPQRWLKLSNKGAFTITDVKQFPENFTL
jgi:OOP family OmpA-OmpF porin